MDFSMYNGVFRPLTYPMEEIAHSSEAGEYAPSCRLHYVGALGEFEPCPCDGPLVLSFPRLILLCWLPAGLADITRGR